MAEPMEETCEAKAFRSHLKELFTLIQEPDLPTLGIDLLASQIISQAMFETTTKNVIPRGDKCSQLLLAILSQLSVHPDKLQTVLDILEREQTYRAVATNIRKTHRKLMTRYH